MLFNDWVDVTPLERSLKILDFVIVTHPGGNIPPLLPCSTVFSVTPGCFNRHGEHGFARADSPRGRNATVPCGKSLKNGSAKRKSC
jgi:hypothetical protein